MKRVFAFLSAFLILSCGTSRVAADKVKPASDCVVYLTGDSTCAPRKESQRPKWGWGEKLAEYLDGYAVVNKAVGGQSTKSYLNEGRWEKVLEMVKKGDVVFIQFGHNDEHKNSESKYAEANGAYYDNLCRFIADVKAKEAVPVILTSLSRRHFKNGTLQRSHKDYPAAAKKAAADGGAVVLDIEQLSFDWLTSLGDEASALRFMVSVDGSDNTHLVELGATEVASMVAHALKTCGNPYLAHLVK